MAERWRYSGYWMTSCNCDWGCPCNFNALPTTGNCEGVIGLKISEGSYGKTSLDGAKAAIATYWPGAIHKGNGVAQVYVDEKTSKKQEEALLDIMSGRAGGRPWAILSKTISTILRPQRATIAFEIKGRDTVLKVPSTIEVQAEPMRNPVTKEEAYADVLLHQNLIFDKGSLFSNKVHKVDVPGHEKLRWSHPGKYLAIAKVKHNGP